MSATERLCRMLDERGVVWHQTKSDIGCVFTWWESPIFGEVHATDNDDGETLFMACLNNCDFTPEQAIAATLGADSKSYDAGFESGVKAVLQQLSGLIAEGLDIEEIDAWVDHQWEEEA